MFKLILTTLLAGLLFIDAILYATRVEGYSDCLIVYTKSKAPTGTLYKFPEGYHVQADRPDYLAQYEVGHADGCIMYYDTAIASVFNTQICYAFRLFNKI